MMLFPLEFLSQENHQNDEEHGAAGDGFEGHAAIATDRNEDDTDKEKCRDFIVDTELARAVGAFTSGKAFPDASAVVVVAKEDRQEHEFHV